jgi:hypothetical protein
MTMQTLQSQPAATQINAEPLLGTWLNTNTATLGISKAVLSARNNRFVLRVFASNNNTGLLDWGEAEVMLFTNSTVSQEAMAFSAAYDFGFMETDLQGHIRQGVLIIAKFDRFKDDSGRSNYISKEFFFSVRS